MEGWMGARPPPLCPAPGGPAAAPARAGGLEAGGGGGRRRRVPLRPPPPPSAVPFGGGASSRSPGGNLGTAARGRCSPGRRRGEPRGGRAERPAQRGPHRREVPEPHEAWPRPPGAAPGSCGAGSAAESWGEAGGAVPPSPARSRSPCCDLLRFQRLELVLGGCGALSNLADLGKKKAF